MFVAFVVLGICTTFTFQAIANGGSRNGIPAFPFVMFGVVALLAAIGDIRMLRTGVLPGSRRIARHLWRMTFALFIASMSFFIGQAKVIPEPLRIRPLLALPVLAVLITMFYWLWRVRARKSEIAVKEKPMRVAVHTAFVLFFVMRALIASAQENPLTTHSKFLYRGVKGMLLRSAELMPEENYGFKPTEAVRSFGQIVGHAADAQYTFCSAVLGEKNPALKIEKTKTTKAELIAALREAFAYCDKAYETVTDANASQPVKLYVNDMPRSGVLAVNSLHSVEHYGNLVVYLRMKNIVPPTSDPDFMKKLSER